MTEPPLQLTDCRLLARDAEAAAAAAGLSSQSVTVVEMHVFKRSYSIAERRVPELIPVLGSQPAGDVSHKPGGRLPLLSARPAVTLATLKRAATNFAAWRTEARWV